MLLFLVQIRTDTLKLKKKNIKIIINRGLYWSYGFKSCNSYVSLSMTLTRELRINLLFQLSVLYLNYTFFRKWKKKKKKKKKKSFIGKEMSSNPQKLKKKKKQLFYKENDLLDLFLKSKT